MTLVRVPTVSIATPRGEATVDVEVVTTPEAIAQGLMFRDSLPYDAGMLFVMPMDAVWAFYMRNTFIPLDMIYIANDWTVAGVVNNAEPCTEMRRSIYKPSSYVLEVNAGWARDHQILPGAQARYRQPTTRSRRQPC